MIVSNWPGHYPFKRRPTWLSSTPSCLTQIFMFDFTYPIQQVHISKTICGQHCSRKVIMESVFIKVLWLHRIKQSFLQSLNISREHTSHLISSNKQKPLSIVKLSVSFLFIFFWMTNGHRPSSLVSNTFLFFCTFFFCCINTINSIIILLIT